MVMPHIASIAAGLFLVILPHCMGFILTNHPRHLIYSRRNLRTIHTSSSSLIPLNMVSSTIEPPINYTPTSDNSDTTNQYNEDADDNMKTFNWGKQWYPLAVEECTDKTKPNQVSLLGNNLVLWFNGEKWAAFEDSCPHRGVPLSEGRIEKNGDLLCAYHAWTFDSSGACTNIPQTNAIQKTQEIKLKACTKVYPTQVIQGIIWVWGEKGFPGSDVSIEAAMKRPRLIEELNDPAYKGRFDRIVWSHRDLPYGWDIFMENVVDPAHVPVSHHNIVGNRYKDAVPLLLNLTKGFSEIPIEDGGDLNPLYPEDKGFLYTTNTVSGTPVGPQVGTTSYTELRPPCLLKISQPVANTSAVFILALYCTPTKPGYSRLVGANILIKGEDGKVSRSVTGIPLWVPTWVQHVTGSLFLHQDMVFLHQQDRMLYHTANYVFGHLHGMNATTDPKSYLSSLYMPNQQDRMLKHLRYWIHKRAGGGVIWGDATSRQGLPPVLPPDELFNVHTAHTSTCTICKGALVGINKVKTISFLFSVIALSVLKTPIQRILAGSFFGLISLAAHKIAGLFFKYEFHHQSNI